jgi:hypothetical protein
MADLKHPPKGNSVWRQPDCSARPPNRLPARSELDVAAIADHCLRGRWNWRARRVIMTVARCANAKTLRGEGSEEAAALATAQMLAEAPKDRSADLLFAVASHDPALAMMRSRCRSASVARRLDFVADTTLSLPNARLPCGIPPASSYAAKDGSAPATSALPCELKPGSAFPSDSLRPRPW